jgi:hypothetical protein
MKWRGVIKPSLTAAVASNADVGDLVAVVGDQDYELYGLGVVVKRYLYTALIRWSDGDEVRMPHTSIYMVAQGAA